MKQAGKVTGREIKDYGKGKDAEAKEVHFVKVRVDGRLGLPSGTYTFAMTEEEVANGEYEIGQVVSVDVSESQGRINLNNRAKDRRDAATAKAH